MCLIMGRAAANHFAQFRCSAGDRTSPALAVYVFMTAKTQCGAHKNNTVAYSLSVLPTSLETHCRGGRVAYRQSQSQISRTSTSA